MKKFLSIVSYILLAAMYLIKNLGILSAYLVRLALSLLSCFRLLIGLSFLLLFIRSWAWPTGSYLDGSRCCFGNLFQTIT